MGLMIQGKEVSGLAIGGGVFVPEPKWESITYKVEDSTGSVKDVPGSFMCLDGTIFFKSQYFNIPNDTSEDDVKKRLLLTLPDSYSNVKVVACGAQNGAYTSNSATAYKTIPSVNGNVVYLNTIMYESDSGQWTGYKGGTSIFNPAWLQLTADNVKE